MSINDVGINKLIYPELSYRIIGIIYKVYNELGGGYQEKYYQKALVLEFKKEKIKFKEKVLFPLKYQDKEIGKYYLDFLIEDKIVLELKVGNRFYSRDYKQILAYLKNTGLKLGLLLLFTKRGVKFKRILNYL
jgi:GxxExxY protein